MTNNKQMVSVPREALDVLCRIYENSPYISWAPIRAALAAPAEDVRAMVDEPVAWYYAGTDVGNIVSLSRLDHYYRPCGLSGDHEYVKGVPLYRHPAPLCSEVAPQCSEQVRTQEQRKIVMPERRIDDGFYFSAADNAWNACLDEIKRLNGDQS